MENFLVDKPIVVFIGAMGSGKTEVALNYAAAWADQRKTSVHLVDLDVRKPYFRTRDLLECMDKMGVSVAATPTSLSGLDIPALPASIESLLRRPGAVVMDVGGDPEGTRIIGRYREILAQNQAAVLFVVNIKRIGSGSESEVEENIEMMRAESPVPLTGLVNNTHLMWETTREMVEEGAARVRSIGRRLNLPVVFHAMLERIAREAGSEMPEPVLPLRRYIGPAWFHEMDREEETCLQ